VGLIEAQSIIRYPSQLQIRQVEATFGKGGSHPASIGKKSVKKSTSGRVGNNKKIHQLVRKQHRWLTIIRRKEESGNNYVIIADDDNIRGVATRWFPP